MHSCLQTCAVQKNKPAAIVNDLKALTDMTASRQQLLNAGLLIEHVTTHLREHTARHVGRQVGQCVERVAKLSMHSSLQKRVKDLKFKG
jgi:hypothetical protein